MSSASAVDLHHLAQSIKLVAEFLTFAAHTVIYYVLDENSGCKLWFSRLDYGIGRKHSTAGENTLNRERTFHSGRENFFFILSTSGEKKKGFLIIALLIKNIVCTNRETLAFALVAKR